MSLSLPPPQPAYILRGHAIQVHSAIFIRSNARLVTGDADGFIVVWSLATKRPTAVWRAHEAAVLTSSEWGSDRLITHGRDNKLVVWKFTEEDERSMSPALPIDGSSIYRRPPWLLHILPVNALNFCSFAHCTARGVLVSSGTDSGEVKGLLVAVPNAMTSENVDIFHLPSERRIDTVHVHISVKTGMVMAVDIFYRRSTLTLVAGYESGHTIITQHVDGQGWQIIYLSRPHSQPILSLDLLPDRSSYLTSSADAIIAKHAIPDIPNPEVVDLPPTSSSTTTSESRPASQKASLLSLGLANTNSTKKTMPIINIPAMPSKVVQTKHSGQQGLKIRSDGKIFATAGWDTRVRVYSTRSLRELAVLKWHKEGCYAVAFAEVMSPTATTTAIAIVKDQGETADSEAIERQLEKATASTPSSSLTRDVYKKRAARAVTTHWLAAGSKDGKVSLWDIY